MATRPVLTTEVEPCAHALDDDLGWALGVVFRGYVKTATSATAHLPAGPRSYQVLAAASRDQPRTQLALAQQLRIDRTVMTYLLDALEGAGLVRREPDPSDRRARRIVVTKRGVTLLEELDARLRQVEAHVLAGLSEDERTMFRSLLQRVAMRLDALDPVADKCDLVEAMPTGKQRRTPVPHSGKRAPSAN
jgi:DNA-binding MarR family transcriptional regulator